MGCLINGKEVIKTSEAYLHKKNRDPKCPIFGE